MPADPVKLARHADFARRLARGLVADENLADDLVQETWVAVLRRPPREAGSLRAYLATTLRRAAGGLRRGEERRARREQAVARPEALASSAELAAAMEQHQRVVQAVLELREPTKTAILLRFFEDLPPREIAKRTGEPVETVRTRLKRGLAVLRTRLDEREGGREAWAGVLLPLAGSARLAAGTAGAGAAGALLMTTKAKLAVGAVVIVAGGLIWRATVDVRPESVRGEGPASASIETEAAEAVTARAPAADEARRVLPDAKPEEAAAAAPVVASPPPSVLHVVDAVTGTELEGVTLLRGVMHSRDAIHPGSWEEEQVFARAARSPIELSSDNEADSWWVHAPGYEWGWVRVDHRGGGERRVALAPGAADLEIHMEGFDPELNLWVQVFPPDHERSWGSLAHVRHPAEGRLVLRGLPPGEVQVRAELGIWHDGPRELDRERVELLVGVRNEVVLDLEERVVLPEAAPLAGRIVLPPNRPDLELGFEIRPTEGAPLRRGDVVYSGKLALERVPGQPRVRRFDAGEVTPGSYFFLSSPLQFWEAFEVGPRGAPDVVIEVPELGEVRARVLDEESGERLTYEKLTWMAPNRPDRPSWTLAGVKPDAETGEYVFVAPLGRISLAARWGEYSNSSRAIEVTPGTQEVELRVRRLPGTWLRLMDGDTIVPVEWGWSLEVAPTVGKAKARMTRVEGGRAWIAAAEPGIYVVTIKELVGFEPIPPQTLEVEEGEATELVIDLRRR